VVQFDAMTRREFFTRSIVLVSVVLLIATCMGWAVSYSWPHYIPLFRGQRRHVYVGFEDGMLVLRHNRLVGPGDARMVTPWWESTWAQDAFTLTVLAGPKGQMSDILVRPDPLQFCWFARVGNVFAPRLTLLDAAGNTVTVQARMSQVDVALWLLVVLFAPAPLLWYRARQQQRVMPGHCRTCGYDLRATPDRCPECGAMPVAHSSRPTG